MSASTAVMSSSTNPYTKLVAQGWILGTGRGISAVRLAHHRPRVGRGGEPGAFDASSGDACGREHADPWEPRCVADGPRLDDGSGACASTPPTPATTSLDVSVDCFA